jgi:DNA-binding NarL/FixJ family response regulator
MLRADESKDDRHPCSFSDGDAGQAATSRSRPPAGAATVLFVGSPIAFSDRLLQALEPEFGTGGVERVDDPAALAALSPGRVAARIVVFENVFREELLARLPATRAALPGARLVLCYSEPNEARPVIEAQRERVRLGEVLFLPMRASFEVWAAMLRISVQGVVCLPGELVLPAEPPAPALAGPRAALAAAGLTAREVDVLALVAKGKRNKTIAAETGLSENTVKLHMHRIMAKLGVVNRTGAASRYLAAEAAQGRTPGP